MLKILKKYNRAFILGIQSSIEYRASFFLDLASSLLPMVMQYFLWTAIFKSQENESVLGYSYQQLVIYIIFANLIAKFISSGYFKYEIIDDIKNGGLNKYIVRPVGYSGYRLSCFLGEKLPQFIFILFLLIIAFSIFGGEIIDLNIIKIISFISALILALLIQFLLYFAISTIAFFVSEISHLFFVVQMLIDIMSGKIFPLDVFGNKALYVLKWLPFKYIVYYPTNIINGRFSNREILDGFYMQCFWVVSLLMLVIFLWKKCFKHYVSYGG